MQITPLIFSSSLIAGFGFLLVAGPAFGELFATKPPIFRNKKALLANEKMNLAYEEVSFYSGDGLILRGWFYPAEDPHAPAVISAPATSHDQCSGLSLVQPLHRAGYHVLLFSYRGHGQSDGNAFGFSYGARESKDIDAAVNFLAKAKGITKIGLIGHSAGAVSALLSAARNPRVGAVVAASPFSSMEAIWNNNRPKFLPSCIFKFTLRLVEWRKGFSRHAVRPQDVISQISPRPILLIHGEDDQRVSTQQAKDLFLAAKRPVSLWLVKGASHGEVGTVVLTEQIDQIIAFFEGAFGRAGRLLTGRRILKVGA